MNCANKNALLEFIIREVNKGKKLGTISKEMGKCTGFCSAFLKLHCRDKNIYDTIKKNKKPPTSKIYLSLHDKSQDILQRIENSQSYNQIYKGINISPQLIKRYICLHYPEKHKIALLNGKTNIHTSNLGGTNVRFRNNKGKSYVEIYGSEEKALEMRQKRSKWLKENNIRRYNTKISKPQKQLFDIVVSYFPTAVLDFKIETEHKNYYLDIAIPELKINIEYDGLYWHNSKDQNGKYSDITRDKVLTDLGWKIFRLKYQANPKPEKLTEDFKQLNLI